MGNRRKTAVRQTRAAGRRELANYVDLVGGIAGVLEAAHRASARAVNAAMTATYAVPEIRQMSSGESPASLSPGRPTYACWT